MKTTLLIFLLSVCSLLGNAQAYKFFELDTSVLNSNLITLLPVSRTEPASHEISGKFDLTKKKKEYAELIFEISKQILKPENIPSNAKKASYFNIYFNKDKKIMYITFTVFREMLEYTTEQQWIDFYNQIEAINLDPYIEIPNKESFDFSKISGHFLKE